MRLLVTAGIVAALAARTDAESYVRVLAQKAPIRSGPGNGYRDVYIADRNQVFEVVERGTKDFWFKVKLDDGTTGWIVGDVVFPFEVGDEEKPGPLTRLGRAIKRAILGPSPIPYAHFGLAASAGFLQNDGVYLVRPSWIIDPYVALEGFAGLSPQSSKEVYLGGLAFMLRMTPGSVLCPYLSIGLGAAHITPSATNFVDKNETLMALAAGGGLEITLKKQITLRFDARNWTLFNQNHSGNTQEYSSGIAIFF
jgi:hypothetical protein